MVKNKIKTFYFFLFYSFFYKILILEKYNFVKKLCKNKIF